MPKVIVPDYRPDHLDYAAHVALHSHDDLPSRNFTLGKHTTLPMRHNGIPNNSFQKTMGGQYIRKKFTLDPNEHESDIVPIVEKHNKNYTTRTTVRTNYKGQPMWIPESTTHSGVKAIKVTGKSIIELANDIAKPKKDTSPLARRSSSVKVEMVDGVKHTIITPKRYR